MRYDCHVHVFDPGRWQPAVACELPRATAHDLGEDMRSRGVQRAVLVQPFAYRHAHGCFLEALRRLEARACGIAAAGPHVAADEIARWLRAGVRGVWFGVRRDGWSTYDDIAGLDAVLPAHWAIELAGDVDALARSAALLARCSRTFVCTLPADLRRVEKAQLRRLLWWAEMGNLYFKLVAPSERAAAAVAALAEPVADRLLWGSGWPHQPAGSARWDRWGATLDRNAQALYAFAPDADPCG